MAWHGKELPLLRLAAQHRPAMMLPLHTAVPAAWDGGPRGFQSQSLHLDLSLPHNMFDHVCPCLSAL